VANAGHKAKVENRRFCEWWRTIRQDPAHDGKGRL